MTAARGERMKNPHAVKLGRLGGLAGRGKTSPKKAAAARKNGQLGGRPKGHAARRSWGGGQRD